MTLTSKDLITTGLAVMVASFSYLMLTGYKFPLISSYRWAIGVLIFLGVLMCGLSSNIPSPSSPWLIGASILGFLAVGLAIFGFITGSKIAFISLTGVILVLWALATIRHLIGG